MKIVFLAPHLRKAGGTRIGFTYAHRLAQRGHNVTILVRSKNTLRRSVANMLQIGKPRWIADFKPRVVRVSEWGSFDFAPFNACIAMDALSALFLSEHRGLTPDTLYYLVQHDEGLYHVDRGAADHALGSPLKKIVVSSWLRDIVAWHDAKEPLVLLNPIDRTQFHPVPGLRDSKKVRVLMLHHTYKWKGAEEGVAAVSRLKRDLARAEIELALFGLRETRPEFPHDVYLFNPPEDRLREIYSSADIYLCPSWDEGSGLPSMEAMACKSTLVTYENGGSRDYAFDGKTAYVAKRRDTERLYRKLKQAVENTAERHRIAEAGYQFIQSMPTWEEQTEKLERYLKETIL